MFENWFLCVLCNDVIEKRQGIWWDESNNAVGFGFHKHIPTDPEQYYSHKYGGDIRTEILYTWNLTSNYDDSVGETDTFGYYSVLYDFHAILEVDSEGFVFSHHYDSREATINAWNHKIDDYWEWSKENGECQCGSVSCDYYEDNQDRLDKELEYERRDIDS
jgi:hypothetical protein